MITAQRRLRQVEPESGSVRTGSGSDRIKNEAGFDPVNSIILYLSFDISHWSFEAYPLNPNVI